jgi:hypothetical protein
LLWTAGSDVSILVHKYVVTSGYSESICSPSGSGGQERNDEFERVDETHAHDISSLDTIIFSENIPEVQSGRAQIAVADFEAPWDHDSRIRSQRFRLRNECQERCHRSVRLGRVER